MFLKYWLKVPLPVRAIVLGLSISMVGILSWTTISVVVPLPWSFIAMLAILWIYWQFFSGQMWHKSSKDFRKLNSRNKKLDKRILKYGLLLAALAVIIEQAGLVFTFRLIEFPAEQFYSAYSFLDNIPVWAGWLVIIMISIVAGICEEFGFRGYMQVPLENKYGPFAAISVVSVIFVLVHLHQAWSGPLLLHIFLISFIFGLIAYATKSLIPGIIGHIVMDICNFSFWWSKLGWPFDREPIHHSGLDVHFVMWFFILLFCIAAFVILVRKSIKYKQLIPGQTENKSFEI